MEKVESIEEAMESKLPKEKPKSLALRRNLERLQLELRNVIEGVKKNNGTRGLPRYGVGEELLHQTEANGSEYYTDEEAVIEVKFSSRAEPVPEPLLTPFIVNESAINSSCIHPGEDFSSKATDISQSKGYATDAPRDSGDEQDIEEKSLVEPFVEQIEDLMELQQAHQEENRKNFDSLSLGLDEKEKKIQPDDD
ncbi:uncharacterized protein HKW66_Vig0083030 [Vigna angularis]|uniref:Uncharacterized protein n=1 Tax=Phaseolus angularis TaxID=3914 RepID=A0A8T0KMR2_PHAAN|nr:uncharacterized protein HKW66_Vig0083030 [Vigna angularis]